MDPARFAAWLKDKKSQLETDDLVALAASLRVELPEIDVEDFRRNGYLPEALLNYLALLGWNPGGDVERFETAFLAERFAFDRVGKSNSKFDRDKLRAFNGDAIAAMQPADFYTVWREWIGRHEPGVLEALAPVLEVAAAASQPRVKTLRESLDVLAYALAPDIAIEFDEKAAKKALHKGEPSGLEWLSRVKDELLAVEPFEPDAIDAFVAAYCEREGCGMGKIAQPLRVALTGTAVSPPLGQTLALLGRERVGARIERCLRMGAAERE